MRELSLKSTFRKYGNLNLLENYRGEERQNLPVLGEVFKLSYVIAFWVAAAFGTALFMALLFDKILPIIIEITLFPLLPHLSFLSDKLDEHAQTLITFTRSLAPVMCVLGFLPVNAMFLVLLERKFLALLTTRLGPNRVGPNGMFQTFVDALKLLFKEDITPKGANGFLFFLSPVLFFAPSILLFLPIMSVASEGKGFFDGTALSTSLIFVFAMSSLSVLGLMLAGCVSNNKYSLLGSLRSVAQALSYEIPLILSLVSLVLITGSFSLSDIAAQQSGSVLDWNIFAGGAFGEIKSYLSLFSDGKTVEGAMSFLLLPLQALLFIVLAVIFYGCSLAETNRTPFDIPEAESELVSGFNTEYSGLKFALFFLAEYTNLFATSVLFVILFLGSGASGLPFLDEFVKRFLVETPFGDLSWAFSALILLLKSYLMVMFAIWLRATLPRFRSDQLMTLAWKALIPTSLMLIFIAAICRAF